MWHVKTKTPSAHKLRPTKRNPQGFAFPKWQVIDGEINPNPEAFQGYQFFMTQLTFLWPVFFMYQKLQFCVWIAAGMHRCPGWCLRMVSLKIRETITDIETMFQLQSESLDFRATVHSLSFQLCVTWPSNSAFLTVLQGKIRLAMLPGHGGLSAA